MSQLAIHNIYNIINIIENTFKFIKQIFENLSCRDIAQIKINALR